MIQTDTKRTFATGATRDTDEGKLDYEGFLSPLVVERFGQYMHQNRHMRDGSLRASDNWQKGIPMDAYMKSAWRHFFDWWKAHRQGRVDEEALTALMFNVMGYLHEALKRPVKSTLEVPLTAQQQEHWPSERTSTDLRQLELPLRYSGGVPAGRIMREDDDNSCICHASHVRENLPCPVHNR